MATPTTPTGYSNPIFFAGQTEPASTVKGPLSCTITVSQKNKSVVTATAILSSDKSAGIEMTVVTRASIVKISYAQTENLSEENLEILMDQVSKAYVRFLNSLKKAA